MPFDPTPIREAEMAWRSTLRERLGIKPKAAPAAEPVATEAPSPVESQLRASLAERTGATVPEVPAAPVDPAAALRTALIEQAQKLRQEVGSRDAARSLGLKRDAFKKLAPAESTLPLRAQRAIDARLEKLTPEQQRLYLEMAPNALARDYIKAKLGL